MKRKTLLWELVPWPCATGYPDAWRAKVGRGYLWLLTWDMEEGIHYVSSFGANSDDSYSGFLPGLTIEQAKLAVLDRAAQWWKGGPNELHD